MADAKKTAHPAAPKTTKPAPVAVQEAARRITGEDKVERDKAAAVLADWAGILAEDTYAGPAEAGVRIDVEKSVPEPIRVFVERLLEDYNLPVQINGRTIEPGTSKPQHKTFDDATTAVEFIRLCHYYAKYRPAGRITVRATQLAQRPETVRVSAQPFTPKPRKT